MVPEITTPHSMKRALNYNERKVQRGQAELIHAANFLKLPEELNFYNKLERFEKQMELNDRAKTKTIHISLNFHPSETFRLDKELLKEITGEYMKKMGFENQPYLVYQHFDAGHPHVHVVSTLIRDDGSRIPTHNLGRNQSETVRKELEETYGLVKANKKEVRQLERQPVNAQKVQYGKTETKRSITNVLDAVIDRYKYTSLAELNAVLKLYNVMADRGNEEGRIYKNRGLTYRILDENGQKLGVPIKASDIYSKPTLNRLEEQFVKNEQLRKADLKQIKTSIDWVLAQQPETFKDFIRALEKERIQVAVRQNEKGFMYGLTYIDHTTQSVFNGSDIGKTYSAKAMQERFARGGVELQPEQKQEQKPVASQAVPLPQQNVVNRGLELPSKTTDSSFLEDLTKGITKTMEQVIQPEEPNEQLAYELREEQRRKRKKEQEQQREL